MFRGTSYGQDVITKIIKPGVEESPIDENGGGGSNICYGSTSVFVIINNVIIISFVIVTVVVIRWFKLKLPLLWSPQESKT